MTGRSCLTAEEAAAFVRGGGSEAGQAHLHGCAQCQWRVAFLRRIHAAGVEPIADAAAEIDELIARLLAAPRNKWWKLALEPEYRQPAVVRRLLALAVDARLRDGRLSIDLVKTAATIVDVLPNSDPEVRDLRFDVWKFSTFVLHEAARYAETAAALVHAEAAARTATDPELAFATLRFSRALYCAEPDIWQPEQANTLLDAAEQVFGQRGDRERLRGALIARAFLLFRAGNLPAARDAFATILESAAAGDREEYLNSLSNLLWVRVELRDVDNSVEQATTSLCEENERLGRKIQAARARWLIGRIDVIRGRYDSAIRVLREAMADMEDSDASIRIGLDTIEALLLDDRYDEAFALARELASVAVALDRREPNRRRALTAQVFAYLREAAQRQALTADLAAEAGRYVDRITRRKPVEFVPPMPLADM